MWPTPEAGVYGTADVPNLLERRRRYQEKYGNNGFGLTLGQQVAVDMALWPTPTAVDRVRDEETLSKCAAFRKRNANQNTVPLYLGEVARDTALWPTPTAQDGARGSGTIRPHDTGHPLPQRVAQALWSTPRASDGEKGGPNMSFGAGGQPLPAQAAALWRTPNTVDAKGGTRTGAGQVQLCHQAAASGATPSGSPERTASPGALDPIFVAWMMGYPPHWLECAPAPLKKRAKR